MKEEDCIELVNRCLREIGKPDFSVTSLEDDIFDSGLSSIDRLLLLTKIEELTGQKIDIAQLGSAASLNIGTLVGALEGAQ